MTLYLGVDGGGTGCRAAVADGSGRVLGQGAGGPANIWTDPDGALASILAAARQALEAAAPRADPADVVAGLGLAGANVSGMAERLAPRLPFRRSRIESDAAAAVRGALGSGDGVAAAIGTGSVFGSQRDGVVRIIGGWGFQLGDHASGMALGRALCVEALLAHDGETGMTPVLAALLAEKGGPAGLVAWGKEARPADFAGLVPRLLAAEAAGDPAAGAILRRADGEVARAIDRLMAEGEAPLCFLGGLGPVFALRLAERYGPLVRPALGTGLDGALALARTLEG